MSKWTVDIEARMIKHESGFVITFEGEPDTDHFIGAPKHYPKELNPLQLSRLIREGFEAFRVAWKETTNERAVLLLKTQ